MENTKHLRHATNRTDKLSKRKFTKRNPSLKIKKTTNWSQKEKSATFKDN